MWKGWTFFARALGISVCDFLIVQLICNSFHAWIWNQLVLTLLNFRHFVRFVYESSFNKIFEEFDGRYRIWRRISALSQVYASLVENDVWILLLCNLFTFSCIRAMTAPWFGCSQKHHIVCLLKGLVWRSRHALVSLSRHIKLRASFNFHARLSLR